jgi:hypothetical protein
MGRYNPHWLLYLTTNYRPQACNINTVRTQISDNTCWPITCWAIIRPMHNTVTTTLWVWLLLACTRFPKVHRIKNLQRCNYTSSWQFRIKWHRVAPGQEFWIPDTVRAGRFTSSVPFKQHPQPSLLAREALTPQLACSALGKKCIAREVALATFWRRLNFVAMNGRTSSTPTKLSRNGSSARSSLSFGSSNQLSIGTPLSNWNPKAWKQEYQKTQR